MGSGEEGGGAMTQASLFAGPQKEFQLNPTHRTILRVLEKQGKEAWTPSYELQKVETPWGWIGTSGDVRCRELERAGYIKKKKIGPYTNYQIT